MALPRRNSSPGGNPLESAAPVTGNATVEHDEEPVDLEAQLYGGEEDDTEDKNDHSRLKWILAIIAAVLVLVLLVVGVWFASTPKNSKVRDTSSTGSSAIGDSGGGSAATTNVDSEDSFMEKIGVPKYYRVAKDDQKQDQATEASNDAIASAPANESMMPSKAANPALTDDPAKAFNADGTVNPDYSYITSENTIPVIVDDMERLVNPVYGQWTGMQAIDRVDVNGNANSTSYYKLGDMLSQSLAMQLNSEDSARQVLPLYADWDRDYYGGKYSMKLNTDPIIGVINNYDCVFNVQGNVEDTITCFANVTYSGQVKGKTITEDKTLKLNYKVNYDETSYSSRRILLTSISQ